MMIDKTTATEWSRLRMLVLQRDNHTCVYCGCAPRTLCVDHKTPLCQGGGNELNNLAAACRRCNTKKGKRTVEQWRNNDYVDLEVYQLSERFTVDSSVMISENDYDELIRFITDIELTFPSFCAHTNISQSICRGIMMHRKAGGKIRLRKSVYDMMTLFKKELEPLHAKKLKWHDFIRDALNNLQAQT